MNTDKNPTAADSAHLVPVWHWEIHPNRKGMIALACGPMDVLLPTSDGEHTWIEVTPENARLLELVPAMVAALEQIAGANTPPIPTVGSGGNVWASIAHVQKQIEIARAVLARRKI